jgi:elongation factor G
MPETRSFRDLNYRQATSLTGIGESHVIRGTAHGGQYAHVELAVEPLGSGVGIEFVEEVADKGAIPERFLSHIEIGCLNAARRGLWGFPLEDVRIRILDGSYHDVDSSNAAFEEAAGKAMLDAMQQASPCLLEPCLTLTVRVPEKYVGDVLGDINRRRARIESGGSGLKPTFIFSVPESETLDYPSALASLSGGSAIWSIRSPKTFRKLPDSLAVDRFCDRCQREMKIPLIHGQAFTENCLICGTAFGPPDAGVGVRVSVR